MTTISFVSVPHQLLLVGKQHPCSINTNKCSQTSLPKSSFNLRCSSSSSSSSTPVIEDAGSASQSESESAPPFPLSGCKACGKDEIERGCNGEGRIQGGIATVPGFGWWPIKAYRPCPEFVASGGRYRRQGQSMDEVAGFGRVEKAASIRASNEPQSRRRRKEKEIMADSPKMQQKIEEAVIEILKNSNMDETTEYKVRKMASEKLGLDLSPPERKQFVRKVVESYLADLQSKAEAAEQVEEEEPEGEEDDQEEQRKSERGGAKEYDADGDLIICRLTDKRRVTITDFRGKTLVSLREYYKKDGKELPTSKGISLTAEQWSSLKKNVPAIEKAIKKMDSRLN